MQVLNEARDFLANTADENDQTTTARIIEHYNANCDRESVGSTTPEEYSLACTFAIGALAEQEGSNIAVAAAIQNITAALDNLNQLKIEERQTRSRL